MIDTLLLAARATLAVVFAVAAVAKLRGRAEFLTAVRAFGVPASLSGVTAVTLPLIEAGIAVALLTGWAWQGAIGAGALLAVFTMGIAGNLLRGRSPACRCFGQLQAKPIGADTLVRNAALLALAAAVVGAGPSRSSLGLLHALSALTGASALAVAVTLGAAVIIATQAVLQWNLILQHGRLLRRIDHLERHTGAGGVAAVQPHGASMKQLAVGAIAPEFELEASEGGALSLATLRSSGLPVLLVFTEAGCPACRDFMPRLREWEDRLAGIVRIAVITAAAPDRAHVAGVRTALFQRGREISDAYGVSAIPAGLTVRADGTVSSTVMLGGDAIATLLPAPPAAEKGGAAIPIIEALA